MGQTGDVGGGRVKPHARHRLKYQYERDGLT